MSYDENSSDDVNGNVRFARYQYKILPCFLVRLHELCLRMTPSACGNFIPVEALWTVQGELVLDMHSFKRRFCRFQNCGDEDCTSLINRYHLESSLEDTIKRPHIDSKSPCKCSLVPAGVLVFHDEEGYGAVELESLTSWGEAKFRRNNDMYINDKDYEGRFGFRRCNSVASLFFIFVVYINVKTYTCRWRIANFFLNPKVGTKCVFFSEGKPENTYKDTMDSVVEAAVDQWIVHANPNRILVMNDAGRLIDDHAIPTNMSCPVQLCDMDGSTVKARLVAYWPFDKYKGVPAFIYNALMALLHALGYSIELIGVDLDVLVNVKPRYAQKYRYYIWNAVRKPLNVHRQDNPQLAPKWLRTSEDGYDTTYNYRDGLDNAMVSKYDAELHLELMTWQLVPAMDPSKIMSLRIGVLGLGTLGTCIIRQLLAWGVSRFNIVDNARVTNASRQSLYSFADLNMYKVEAAYEAIKAIRPDAHVKKYAFTIPMPGHHMDKISADRGIDLLNKIMDESDVVFLTTDSKESRWLPTLIAASRNLQLMSSGKAGLVHVPLVISARLSFDTWMVVRHSYKSFVGACFFCSETGALGGSAIPGRVDERCTLIKPGTCGICSSVAVELLMALVQHDKGFEAPHDSKSVLGPTPHCVRMQSGDFGIKFFYGEPSAQCMGCGKELADLVQKDASSLVNKALADPQHLAEVSGISQVINAQLLDGNNNVEHITDWPAVPEDCQ